MAVSEQKRHQLYNKAVEVFGEEEAVILMAHLPPGGWSNLATKQDLLELESRLESRLMGRVHGSLSDLKTSLLRTILAVNVAMVVVVAGIAFGAAGLR